MYRIPCAGCDQVYIGETERSIGERLKEHTAKVANNTSAIAEHHQETGHNPDTDNIKVLCREDKLIPRKVREAISIKKETKPTLNRDGGRELSKIYDSLLETPRSRTSPTSGFRRGSVSRDSASTRWGRWWVSPKYTDQKCECCWIVLTYFWCLLPIRIRTFIRDKTKLLIMSCKYHQSKLVTNSLQIASSNIPCVV